MKPNICAFAACAVVSLLLAACQKADEPPKPVTSDSGAASAPATAPASSSGSVAAPPTAVPPSDAAMKPDSAGSAPKTSGDHNAASQATPKDLSKPEEKTAMPMPGQANDHSNTAAPSASDSSQK